MSYKDDWPILIIVPSSARYQWLSESTQLLSPEIIPENEIVLFDKNKTYVTSDTKILIISYGLVDQLKGTILHEYKNNVIIVDECHYMKNINTNRTKVLIPLIHKSKRAILLSGTPALSRPLELFTQLHSLDPKNWADYKVYTCIYVYTTVTTTILLLFAFLLFYTTVHTKTANV